MTASNAQSGAWRTWTKERLEREYSPSSTVPDIGAEIEGYVRDSAAARAACPPTTVRYGVDPSATIDLFRPPANGPHPTLIYVHGGYWQELSKNESAFMVPALLAHGVAVAVVDYPLAPAVRLPTIIAQCSAACRHVVTEAGPLGLDRARLVVSGSSAGGHLAAMVLGEVAGLAGGILVSGVYDLVPLVGTSVNDALGLDEPAAEPVSPMGRSMAARVPLVLAVGEIETGEFHRQTAEFAERKRGQGHPVAELRAAGRHHFDLPYDLGNAETRLGQLTLSVTLTGGLA